MSASPTVPLLHIGYQKTGTTTLQQHFFNRIPGCVFVTYYGPAGDPLFRSLTEHLRRAPADEFRPKTVRAYLDERVAAGDGPLVVSDENLAGEMWVRGASPGEIAERLHRVLPEARVLCCVREQGARLRSLYSLYVKQGGYGSFTRYITEAAPGYRIDLDRMGYDVLVERYQALFGPDRVHVMAYEVWQRDPQAFLAEVGALVGTPEGDGDPLPRLNPGLTRPSQWAMRASNRLFRRSKFNRRPTVVALLDADRLRTQFERVDRRLLTRAPRSLSRSDERIVADIRRRFAESNERLAALTGLPLGDLGYALPGDAAVARA